MALPGSRVASASAALLPLLLLLLAPPVRAQGPRLPVGLARAAGGRPFPPVERMYGAQVKAMRELAAAAHAASAAAAPRLLELLGSPGMRAKLRECCAASGVADWPAERLLGALRDNLGSAELVHNFENGHSGLTLELLLHNATDYLPSNWQLIYLGYYGPVSAKFGHPASLTDAAEEGFYRVPPFSLPHDLPGSWEEASSRVQYVALNLLRLDAGNPSFGNVSAVMSPAFWRDAVAAAPMDSGIYTSQCNKTYLDTPGHQHIPVTFPVDCRHDPTPGVAGAMDHALLNNHLFWNTSDVFGTLFARWYGANESWTNVSLASSETYLETNPLANVALDRGGIKLLVGAFVPLFGTPRGRLLQQFAASRGIALAWALGAAVMNPKSAGDSASFAFASRILDVTTSKSAGLNVTASGRARRAFEALWRDVAAARGPGGALPQAEAWSLWAHAERELPAARLAVPAPGMCSDWETCVGALLDDGACACYRSKERAGIYV